MTPEQIAEQAAATAAAEKAKLEAEEKAKADTKAAEDAKAQDLIKQELEKVKSKTSGKTELEKALFTKQQIEKRIKELGGTEDNTTEKDDDTPVTIGDLRKIEKEKAQKTALTMAEDITDQNEKELVKHHIENTIRASGDPEQDLRNARAIVNSIKNSQILEEIARKTTAKSTSSGTGAPAKHEENFEPTQEEMNFMKAPFSLTKEQIIAARKKE